MKYSRPISELLDDCIHDLREPFTAPHIVAWFASRYPDVKESAVRAHIQALTGNVPNREENHPYLGHRPPILRRISRGHYVRWTGSAFRETSQPRLPEPRPPSVQPSAALQPLTEWFWEGNIQARVIAFLVAQNWDILRVANTSDREAGTDVVAARDGRRLHLEVKGWPSASYRNPDKAHLAKPTLPATQARVWFNDAVVHGLRLREAHDVDDVGLVFPDFPTYRRLLEGVAGCLRRCPISVIFVDEVGACRSLPDEFAPS